MANERPISAYESAIRDAFVEDHLDNPRTVYEIAFNFGDWEDDLRALAALQADPSRFSDAECQSIIMDFLVHVPNHLQEAYRLVFDESLELVEEISD